MIGRIYHVGLTVSDLDRSVAFYRDILGLAFQGEIFMEGKETDKMFRKLNCKARVAYLNGSKAIETPPVELIQFVDSEIHKEQSDLFTTSISAMRLPMCCMGTTPFWRTKSVPARVLRWRLPLWN